MTTEANGAGDAMWVGPPKSVRTPGPCVDCGALTTRHVLTAVGLTPRKGAFTGEIVPRHESCQFRGWSARVERRLADPDVHPEARPRLAAEIAWAQMRVLELERLERGLPPAA